MNPLLNPPRPQLPPLLTGDDLKLMAQQARNPILEPYNPTLRDKIGNAIYDGARAIGLGGQANRMRQDANAVVDFVPGVGDALAVDDTRSALKARDYAGAAAAGLGVVPVAGDALRLGGRVARDFRYHRMTRGAPDTGVGYMMFGENPDSLRGYGQHHHVLDETSLSPNSIVDADDESLQGAFADALRNSDLLSGFHASPEQIASELAPRDIVDSAGVFDNPDLVQLLWDEVLEPRGLTAVRTSNGVIAFDPENVITLGKHEDTLADW